MAKVVSDEILKLKIIINGDDAQKRVTDLELANKKLSDSISSVKREQTQLSAQRKREKEELRGVQLAISEVTAQMNARSGASKKLESTLVSLQKQEAELKNKTDLTSSAFAKNKTEIEQLSAKISENKLKIDSEIKSMDIMSLTSQQLLKRTNDLKFAMSNMNPNSQGYKEANAEMQRLTGRMTELKTGAVASSNSIGNLADKFNRYQGVALAVTATLTGVALSLQSVIDLNNKLADAQTTVSKTTGMNKREVDELTKSFSEFNTRSARMDLLKISEIGGRLGVPKEEIKDFTREVDKAFVALGDGFSGGVEAVANKLGKIKGLFKETKDMQIADAMNQIGSAMNELGASGAASEENIAEFALRVGSLPEGLKPTVAEALALGAAFEESGIDAERGATSYSNFISIAAKNTKGFAEVMGKTQKEVKDLLNTDPTEFFLQFSEMAKGMDATDIAKVFEKLGISDQFVSKIVGSASESVERFRKSIDLSNKSLQEATSLQVEFDKVNNNAAAVYDKVRKKFIGMFTSDAVAKSINFVIEGLGKMIGAIDDTSGRYSAFANTIIFVVKILTIGTVAVFSYNAALTLTALTITSLKTKLLTYTIVQKVNNLLNQSGAALQNIYNASLLRAQIAYFGLTRNTVAQTAAQQRLNLMTPANPWIALVAVVVALTAAYFFFRKEVDETVKKQKILNDINKDAAQNAAAEISTLDRLYKAATNAAKGKDAQRRAAEELIKLYPEQFKNQSAEIIMNGKAEASYNALRISIINAAKAKAAQSKLEQRAAERLVRDEELDNKIREETKRRNELKANPTDKTLRLDGGDGKGYNVKLKGEDRLKSSEQRLSNNLKAKENNKKADALEDEFLVNIVVRDQKVAAVQKKTDSLKIPAAPSGKEVITKKTAAQEAADEAQREYEALRKKILDSAENFNQEELELQAKLQDAKAELLANGYEKELAQLQADEAKKLADFEKEKYSAKDYAELNSIIAREKGNLKLKFEAIKAEWLKQDAVYSELQQLEIQKTNLKILSLQEKYILESYKKADEAFQKKIDLLKRESNLAVAENDTVDKQKVFLASRGYSEDTLNKIRTWEQGRIAIEKEFQKKELTEKLEFLQRKVAEFNAQAALNPISLTEGQLEIIEEYRQKISELLAEISKLKNGESTEASAEFSSLRSIGGNTDLLGLSTEQWSAMFKNTNNLETNILKVAAALQVAQNMFAQYSAFAQANEQAMLRKMEDSSNRKQRKLKKELTEGYINQETYKKLTLLNESELDKKKAEIEYKAAKRQRAMAIAQTITNTAVAIMGIWKDFPKADFGATAAIMSGVVGALGAVQLMTIMKQPLPEVPGAEEGYYPTIRQQDGKLFNARRKRSATGMYNEPTMLVGEGGASMPELVVSGKDLKRINPTIQRQYMNEIARVKGYEDGLYPNKPVSSGNDDVLVMAIAALNRNSEVMEWYKDNRIEAFFDKTARNGKDLKETVKKYEKLETKSKN